MRAYRTLLPQDNDVADGQAVPGKILWMGSVELHVQVIQTSFCTAVRRERAGINRLVMVKCRLKPMFPEILRIHKAKLCQFRISAELINAVAVCRILLECFLPSVFRDNRKLLFYSLPVCAVNAEDAVMIQNLRFFESHCLGIVPIEKIYRHITLKQLPPQYDQYCKYSKLARAIYGRYSDRIEPFGMDECWVDISPICRTFDDAEKIAHEIRTSIKEELGLTVSIGVSFSKVLAKLGSDMKKPDAVTVLSPENWEERVWPLPVSELLYVGHSTTRKLMSDRVNTPFTAEHFVAYCLRMVGHPYWYGTCGYKATSSLLSRKAKQYPSHYGSSRTNRYKQDISNREVVCDCIGGAKGYAWTGGGQAMLDAIHHSFAGE